MMKPGTKYIIEVETVYESMPNHTLTEVPKNLNHIYRIKGFSSLFFDQWGLRKLELYRDMKGPYGIGCVVKIKDPHIKPKNRKEMIEGEENGTEPKPTPNPVWMITHVDMHEDGTWTYIGIKHDGEEIKVESSERLQYTGLFFNTVVEWAKYQGELNF